MEALRARIRQVACTTETVLITGESGTGKELVARSVHAASHRAAAPLVSLNCPVLSAQLMESELFGHERGAFTGADSPRTGRFELADGGTILLDEISEIDPGLQAKLLRVLQERTFEKVGSSTTRDVDVRVLATTNRDLRREVAAGRFREDLYYRLAVVPLIIPPLRQRPADVPELVDHFLRRAAGRLDRPPCTLDGQALDLLVRHHWPGNVRELENIITRASVLNSGDPISSADPRDLAARCAPARGGRRRDGARRGGKPGHGIFGQAGIRRRAQSRRHGAQADRSHTRTVQWPSRQNGPGSGDRNPHALGKTQILRLWATRQSLVEGRVGAGSRGRRAEGGERRAESGERRAESGEQRAEGGERAAQFVRWDRIDVYAVFVPGFGKDGRRSRNPVGFPDISRWLRPSGRYHQS